MKLTPCASCDRHLKADERVCPFCGAQTARSVAWAVPLAAVVVGAAIASASCGEMATPIYGIPPMPDSGVMDSGIHPDAGS